MTDFYLCFNTRNQAIMHLKPLGMTYIDDEGAEQIRQASHEYALWEVGEIQSNPNMWHVNIRIIDDSFDASSLEQWKVFPKRPVCAWA